MGLGVESSSSLSATRRDKTRRVFRLFFSFKTKQQQQIEHKENNNSNNFYKFDLTTSTLILFLRLNGLKASTLANALSSSSSSILKTTLPFPPFPPPIPSNSFIPLNSQNPISLFQWPKAPSVPIETPAKSNTNSTSVGRFRDQQSFRVRSERGKEEPHQIEQAHEA